jgi:hypothetical protein
MSTTEKVLRAEKFELVDQTGTIRAVLGSVSSTVHGLTLYDPNGRPRAGLGVSADGTAMMQLLGPQSTVAVVVEESGVAKVVFMKDGLQRIGLGVLPDGLATLSFFDVDMTIRVGLMMRGEDGQPGLILRSDKGNSEKGQAPEKLTRGKAKKSKR